MRTLQTLLSFAAAVVLAQCVPELPPRWLASMILAAGLCGAVGLILWSRPAWLALPLTAALLVGAGYTWLRADVRMAAQLPAAWEGRDVVLSGVIDELPQADSHGIRFAFAVERVLTPGATIPPRIALGWYRATSGELLGEPLPALRAGERWQLTVRLKRPHGYANPDGFDGEAWLLENNLRATGSVRNDEPNRRLAAHAGRAVDYVNQWRDRLRARMQQALAGQRYAGVLIALAIGDQRAIADADWALFNATAVSHLLSISGAHVTLFAVWVAWLVNALWRRSPGLIGLMPAQQAAALAAALIAVAYATLAGFAVPAQRTCYMLLAAAAVLSLRRRASAWLILIWALVVVLLIDPWAALAVGFWFSFVAVALLMYVSVGRVVPRPLWQTMLLAQLAVTVGLAPLSIAFFQQASLVGPFANAVAIPLITFIVVPLTLIWLVLPFDVLLSIAHLLVQWLASGLQWLLSWPYPLWTQHAPAAWTVLLAMAGALQLLAPRGWPHRWLGVMWCLPLFLVVPARPDVGQFRLALLDVGQGTAAVIETARHTLVYDTGPRWPGDSDAGARIIAPFLRSTGASRIDTLVVSHLDSDHSGGTRSLLDSVPVNALLTSIDADSDLVRHAQSRGVASTACAAGQRWNWDDVRFEILHPGRDSYDDTARKTNDRSCVLRVSAGKGAQVFSALLSGDIEAASERELLHRYRGQPQLLRSDVLLVPHHGSRTSSTAEFIAMVQPSLALVNAGYRNRFGHPREDVLARYEERSVPWLRTDWHGAVLIESAPGRRDAVRWRERRQRYWVEHPDRDDRRPIE